MLPVLNPSNLENLFAYIQTITHFSAQDWEYLSKTLTSEIYHRGNYLLKPGETCTSIFFISQGYCRVFYSKAGEEINTNFYFENDFATNIKSLIKNEKSDYAIQACEQLIVLRFDKNKLLNLYKKSQEIESFGRKLLEIILAQQEEHATLFKLFTARERYEYLLKNQPKIIQRVSLTQIASYLGMTRETLSRIRSKK